MSEDGSALLWWWGGDGSRKLSQAIDKSGLRYSVIISGLPAFTEMEEMTSGGQSGDWKVRKRAKCPSDLFFMLQWKVGKPLRLTLFWTLSLVSVFSQVAYSSTEAKRSFFITSKQTLHNHLHQFLRGKKQMISLMSSNHRYSSWNIL